MTTQCTQCGHENNPQYRFCGICGAPLGPPPPRTSSAGEKRFTPPVSGPSFLGLGDERTRDLDYLLEDEAPRGHGRLYLALLLLTSSAGLLAWHWQRDGYPWAGLIQRQAASSAPASAPPAPVPGPVTTTEPPIISLPPEAQSTTATGEGTLPTPTGSATGSGATSDPATAAAKSPDQTPEAQTPERKGGSAAGEPAAKPSTASPGEDETDAPESYAPRQVEAVPAVPMRKSAVAKAQPAAPSISPVDQLAADGEKYLYGRGARANCDLAQRNLLIAARQSNPKAQTLLGAMYATGHCVNRDLPTAYRWFAQALHGDPGNFRVQRDLEVLWKQMTPEERRLAAQSR
jgi:hypothetical protein